jgi:hypothetical protein
VREPCSERERRSSEEREARVRSAERADRETVHTASQRQRSDSKSNISPKHTRHTCTKSWFEQYAVFLILTSICSNYLMRVVLDARRVGTGAKCSHLRLGALSRPRLTRHAHSATSSISPPSDHRREDTLLERRRHTKTRLALDSQSYHRSRPRRSPLRPVHRIALDDTIKHELHSRTAAYTYRSIYTVRGSCPSAILAREECNTQRSTRARGAAAPPPPLLPVPRAARHRRTRSDDAF